MEPSNPTDRSLITFNRAKQSGTCFAHCTVAIRVLAFLICAIAAGFGSGHSMASEGRITTLPSGVVPADKGGASATPESDQLLMEMLPGVDGASVIVELHNLSDQTVYVLRDDTPFDDVPTSNVLHIIPAGKAGISPPQALYIGPVYRRLAPDASRFLELPPAGSLSATIDIAEGYQLPFDGQFQISYAGSLVITNTQNPNGRASIGSQANVWLPDVDSIELTLKKASTTVQPRALQPNLDSCSVSQQRIIETATIDAENFANESLQSLINTPVANRATSPRYTTWFGTYTQPNYAFVTTVFDRIYSVLSSEVITYRCRPERCSSSSTVAYVQPFLREDINLCPLFFDNRLNNEYRAGTVIHELSHLLRIGNTDDLAYGAAASAALARNSAIDALDNADNHTLFATNNEPELPMVDDGSTIDTPPVVPVNEDDSSGISIVPLLAGETARNTSLAQNDLDGFSVRDVAAVELISLSGDADLYVFSSLEITEESFVCSSQEYSSESVLDSCQIVGDGDYFVYVRAFTDASYQLTAVPRANQGGAVAVGAIELSVGQVASGSLSENEVEFYTAKIPGRMLLTTLTGDADLYVFSDSSFSEDALVCRSVLETPQDLCELTDTGTAHLAILGYTANNSYELVVDNIPPANDDPEIVLASNSSGGAMGKMAMFVLVGFALLRRRLA